MITLCLRLIKDKFAFVINIKHMKEKNILLRKQFHETRKMGMIILNFINTIK